MKKLLGIVVLGLFASLSNSFADHKINIVYKDANTIVVGVPQHKLLDFGRDEMKKHY